MERWSWQRCLRLVAVCVVALTFLMLGSLVVSANSPVAVSAAATVTPVSAVTSTPKSEDMVESAIMDDFVSPTAAVQPSPTDRPAIAADSTASSINLILNGSFEDGFSEGIGIGWERFASASVQAGWEDDTWAEVIYDGENAQLLSLKDAREPDRYVGIFQPITLVVGKEYLLTLHGLVRSDAGSITESEYGYRMQYGFDYQGGTDWQSADISWLELPWDEQPRTGPINRIEVYTATVKPETGKATLFIRGLKKWTVAGEGNYDIDGVSLVAVVPGAAAVPTATSIAAPAPAPTQAAAQATPSPEMPKTGDPLFGNESILLTVNIAVLVLLIGGVVWKLSRRQA